MSTAVVKSTEMAGQTAHGPTQAKCDFLNRPPPRNTTFFVREKPDGRGFAPGSVIFWASSSRLVEGFNAGKAGGRNAALDGQFLPAWASVSRAGPDNHVRPLFLRSLGRPAPHIARLRPTSLIAATVRPIGFGAFMEPSFLGS